MQKFGSGDFDVVCGQCGISLLAGGIIPSVFLPELVQKVGNMTVTAL
ncbi:MAG: hypothetical protein ACLTR6_00220 [Clostridium fessum]